MDIKGKIERELSGLEKLAANIPGYQGYKEKEVRREADKVLRLHLAQQFQEQRSRLNQVQVQLTDTGRIAGIVTLERAMMKLQLLIDRLKTASYGHAGLFDAVKVKEKELDALYAFDSALSDGVDGVATLIDQLSEAAATEQETGGLANKLVATLEELNSTFSQRQDVILES
ncbi:MAG: hypothetical protein ACE5NP_01265 [Anaerolineae bacterium]